MTRKQKVDFGAYKSPPRVSLRKDIVAFLLWARKTYPGVFVSYAEICQRVNGFARMPSAKNKEVAAVQGATSAVRRLLMADHQCGLVTHPLYGARATTDDSDMLATQMVKASKNLKASQRMFTATSELIDIKKVSDTPQLKPLKEWFKSDVQQVVKAINTTDFAARLLPPHQEESDKNGTSK